MDVVYPLKRAGYNRELRYSLRSLKNLPHDRVFIVGEIQPWVRNVIHIPVPQDGPKAENSLRNIITACQRHDLSDDFVLMNDDFYILSRQESVPHFHLGSLDEWLKTFPHRSDYWELASETRRLLKRAGVARPKFYGIHIPTVLNKHKVLALCERFRGERIMLRTLYHNIYRSGGRKRDDVKKHKPGMEIVETDYLSSSNGMIKRQSFKGWLHRRFPEPSEYEG